MSGCHNDEEDTDEGDHDDELSSESTNGFDGFGAKPWEVV